MEKEVNLLVANKDGEIVADSLSDLRDDIRKEIMEEVSEGREGGEIFFTDEDDAGYFGSWQLAEA